MSSDNHARTQVRDQRSTASRAALDDAYSNLNLTDLGWHQAVRRLPPEALDCHPLATPARVVRVDRGNMLLVAQGGQPPLHVRDRCDEPDPASVGDWVLIEPPELGADGLGFARVRVPRTGVLARRRATDSGQPQALAVNVDAILVVEALHPERTVNTGRIARLTALASATEARVHVVLTHADRVDQHIESIAGHTPLATSIIDGHGLDELRDLLVPGSTVVMVGASGSGKSSLVNALAGSQLRAVATKRASGTGRHTTSTGQLIPLESGVLLIDTPGIRSLGMHADIDAAALAPSGFAEYSTRCRFTDCAHDGEPGCEIAAAIDRGELPLDAVATWRKLEREARRERARADVRTRREIHAEQMTRARSYVKARRRGEFGPGR